jgi:hypothetical protein
MTMHEQRFETNESDTDYSAADVDVEQQRPTSQTQSMTQPLPVPGAASEDPAGSGSSASGALFADDELAGMRARWDSVQAGFVDDPRECVVKADGLVSDLIEKLTGGFADARSRLEEKWARGESASTEDLRLALQNYREFFERLLAV